jgi:hypothetical protein
MVPQILPFAIASRARGRKAECGPNAFGCCKFKENVVVTGPGEVAEWTKAPDSKSGVRLVCTGGSNPSLSAGKRPESQVVPAVSLPILPRARRGVVCNELALPVKPM